jgi:hypothetical protein
MEEAYQDIEFDIPVVDREQRILLAHKEWKESNETLPIRQLAAIWGIARSTLHDRLKSGVVSRQEQHCSMQKITVGEERSLREWVLQLEGWGFPPRIDQLRGMVMEQKLGEH